MAWTMGRPRPEPVGLVVKKGSKTRPRASGAMPGPLSSTRSQTAESLLDAEMRITPSSGTTSSALSARFITTCWSRSGSPATRGSASSSSLARRIPRRSASPGEELHHRRDHLVQRDRLRAHLGGAREQEEVRHQVFEAEDLAAHQQDRLEQRGLQLVGQLAHAALDHRELERGGVERIADLVREAGGHRPHRGQLLRHLRAPGEPRFSACKRTCRSACSTVSSKILGARGLDQVGEGAGAHGGDGGVERGEAGEQHHGALGRERAQLLGQRGPLAVGEPDIDQRHVEPASRPRDRLGAGRGHLHLVAGVVEDLAQVVDQGAGARSTTGTRAFTVEPRRARDQAPRVRALDGAEEAPVSHGFSNTGCSGGSAVSLA